MAKVSITPKAGVQYENMIITIDDRELAVDKVGETEAGAVTKLNALGKDGWLLVQDVHIGSNRNALFLVREVI